MRSLGRLGRLFVRIQEYDLKLIHKSGDSNFLPDFLSRPQDAPETVDANVAFITSNISWDKEQSSDTETRQVIDLVKQGIGEQDK